MFHDSFKRNLRSVENTYSEQRESRKCAAVCRASWHEIEAKNPQSIHLDRCIPAINQKPIPFPGFCLSRVKIYVLRTRFIPSKNLNYSYGGRPQIINSKVPRRARDFFGSSSAAIILWRHILLSRDIPVHHLAYIDACL